MSMQDPLADMLTRIRNAQNIGHKDVRMSASKIKASVASVLKSEGYINDYSVEEGSKPELVVNLKYFNGKPVIERLERLSRPGLRKYTSFRKLPKINGGLGIAIISTNKGVMTDYKARSSGVGGEILCAVF